MGRPSLQEYIYPDETSSSLIVIFELHRVILLKIYGEHNHIKSILILYEKGTNIPRCISTVWEYRAIPKVQDISILHTS